MRSLVRTHIEMFPKVESHYCRESSSKLYLYQDLNIAKMYRLYEQWIVTQGSKDGTTSASVQPSLKVKESFYRHIFNTEFNYSFFKPKKDLCDFCHAYKLANATRKAELKGEMKIHKENKKMARRLLKADKEAVRSLHKNDLSNARKVDIIHVDLQKVLIVPRAEVSGFYYKRRFAIYNFTVYDMAVKTGKCFVWNEIIANRGAIEIASFLWMHINSKVSDGAQDFRIYSDNCAAQNRNQYIFSMYIKIASMYKIKITHR